MWLTTRRTLAIDKSLHIKASRWYQFVLHDLIGCAYTMTVGEFSFNQLVHNWSHRQRTSWQEFQTNLSMLAIAG